MKDASGAGEFLGARMPGNYVLTDRGLEDSRQREQGRVERMV